MANPEDTIEQYRPAEYRRPEPREDSDTDEADPYNQIKPKGPRPSNDPYFFQTRPVRKSKRPPQEDDRMDRRRNTSNARGSRSNSMIGRGSHLAPEASPPRRGNRQPSPSKLDSIQDFLNSKPNPSAAKNPVKSSAARMGRNKSGMGMRDPRYDQGGRDPRYDQFG